MAGTDSIDKYIDTLTKVIESEDSGFSRAVHKELRELAIHVKNDIAELSLIVTEGE
jgi:hypothetical protein